MGTDQWVLPALNAAVVTVLLHAGVSKLVTPHHLTRALTELFPPIRRMVSDGVVRAVTVIEIVVAGALLTTTTRVVGAWGIATLGLAFTVLGTAGALRGSRTPCGCFGGPDGRPLGWTNAGVGIAVCAVGSLNLLVGGAGAAMPYTVVAVVLTVFGSIALFSWRHWVLRRRSPGRDNLAPVAEPETDVAIGRAPRVWPGELPNPDPCVLLVLSTMCDLCDVVADQIAADRLDTSWPELGLVIATTDLQRGADFVREHGLAGLRHHIDDGATWLTTLGVRRGPLALVFAGGALLAAYRFNDVGIVRALVTEDMRASRRLGSR